MPSSVLSRQNSVLKAGPGVFVVYVPCEDPPRLPSEMQPLITLDTWHSRVDTLSRIAQDASKPLYEGLWCLFAFALPIIIAVPLFNAFNAQKKFSDQTAAGAAIALLILLSGFLWAPVFIWKYTHSRRVKALIRGWESNHLDPTRALNWNVKLPGLLQRKALVTVTLPLVAEEPTKKEYAAALDRNMSIASTVSFHPPPSYRASIFDTPIPQQGLTSVSPAASLRTAQLHGRSDSTRTVRFDGTLTPSSKSNFNGGDSLKVKTPTQARLILGHNRSAHSVSSLSSSSTKHDSTLSFVSSARGTEPTARGRVSLDESSRPQVEGRGRASLDESRPRGRPSLDETRSRVGVSMSPKPAPAPVKGVLSNRALPPLPLVPALKVPSAPAPKAPSAPSPAPKPQRISLTSILGNYQNGYTPPDASNRDSVSTTRSISILIDEPAVLQPVFRGVRMPSISSSEPRQTKVSGRGLGEGGVAVDGLGMEEWRPIPNHPDGGVWEKPAASRHGSLLEGQMSRRRAEETQAKAMSEERLKTQRLQTEQVTRQKALLAALERSDKHDERLHKQTHQRTSSNYI